MKKIFLLFVAVCALFACDPTHEKISNDGHIPLLLSMPSGPLVVRILLLIMLRRR